MCQALYIGWEGALKGATANTRELARSREPVDLTRVRRSDAPEESAGLRARVERAALQLRQARGAADGDPGSRMRRVEGRQWGAFGAA